MKTGSAKATMLPAMIEEYFVALASALALAVELAVVVVIAFASGEALVAAVRLILAGSRAGSDARRELWFRFATWIVLALEFALAADIIRTAIAPSWESIGKLGAIAAIRTFLNFFLIRDLERFHEARRESSGTGRDG